MTELSYLTELKYSLISGVLNLGCQGVQNKMSDVTKSGLCP